MQKPSFSTYENYSVNPHPDSYYQALHMLKDLAKNDNIWKDANQRYGVNIRQFTKAGDLVPTVRGDGSIEGFSVEEILSAIRQPTCRAVWDARHENAFPVELYDRDTRGFWAARKGNSFLVSPRDFTGILGHTQEKEGNDRVITYYHQTSTDMKNVPDLSPSYVRGKILVAGFILRQGEEANKVDLTYIVNVDPAGNIPSAFVAMVATEMPLSIARIREYLTEHGFPPYIPQHAETFHGVLQNEFFDRTADSLNVQWKPEGAGSFNVYYDKSRWIGGASVTPGASTLEADFKVTESDGKVTIVFGADATDRNLQVIVKKA
jgi:hypothetical protein